MISLYKSEFYNVSKQNVHPKDIWKCFKVNPFKPNLKTTFESWAVFCKFESFVLIFRHGIIASHILELPANYLICICAASNYYAWLPSWIHSIHLRKGYNFSMFSTSLCLTDRKMVHNIVQNNNIATIMSTMWSNLTIWWTILWHFCSPYC